MTTQHTPMPWTFDQEADNSTDFWVFQANGPARVAVECTEADAAFIVRACNAHDELVAALQQIAMYEYNDLTPKLERCVKLARAALAKVSK